MLTFEKDHVILFTRYTMVSAEISIIPEFIDKIEKTKLTNYFHITKNSITNLLSGSSIIFKGIRTSSGIQTAALKSIEGVTTWVLDEAEELQIEEVFDKIDLSIRTQLQQNRVIIILNPTTKEHFIYKKFFENKGVEPGSNITKYDTSYIHTSYLDNIEYLNESILNQIDQMRLDNPDKWNHIMMGSWLDRAEGVIFNNWEIGDWIDTGDVVWGSDFGFATDPSTLVAVAFDDKTIYVKELFRRRAMNTSDFIEEYRKLPPEHLIIADSAELRLIDEISKSGINIVKTHKRPGSVVEGITIMSDYKIIVDPNSVELIKEFNNYKWSDKVAGKPIDAWNHGIDPIRYIVMSRSINNPGESTWYFG